MKADVRFVTATHRDLETMVEEGSFRRDLLFRINVVTLKIPPLCERTEDIPLLLDTALERFNKRYAKNIRGFTSEALQSLLRYSYPGNVRELLNIVEQTVILCKNGEIGADELPAAFSKLSQKSESHQIAAGSFTEQKLLELLERHGGNKAQVARELGVERTTLWRWIKRLGADDHTHICPVRRP